ncbi:hypothetical protein ACFWWU_36470 [Streptomyces sp. NPDC058650]|uniref:hypothetical protein n=1 Tax=Streptomyces sp. NPDC058650 TaxID=3346575 RepID=UPI0036693B3A
MPAIKPEQRWGAHKYSDAAPVPLVSARCPSAPAGESNAHTCKLHASHDGEHRCICSKKWPAA